MMKNFLKKIFGIDKIEESIELIKKVKEAKEEEARIAEEASKRALEEEAIAKMTPKERASQRGEPWVGVLETHINKENVRNGFFELDWNDEFIVQLKQAGYGYDADPQEEIVDRWFRDLARNVLAEEGQDVNRGAGYINVNKLGGGRSEVK
jgi:hypothetical protein